MARISQATLEFVLSLILTIPLVWFSRDVFTKFVQKTTSFNTLKEPLNELPTTVFCFTPSAKRSIFNNYSLTLNDLISYGDLIDFIFKIKINPLIKENDNNDEDEWFKKPFFQKPWFTNFKHLIQSYNDSWQVFSDQIFYKLGRDFHLYYINETDTKILVELGENQINSLDFWVEKLHTYSSGICYAITPNFFDAHKKLKFQISFDKNMNLKDLPSTMGVYFTSKENSYGIIDMDWSNGNELSFELDSWCTTFKLSALTTKYLESTSNCTPNGFNNCLMKMIKEYRFDESDGHCSTTCAALSLPNITSSSSNLIQPCVTFKDNLCMMEKLHNIMKLSKEKCPKNCTTIEYTGRPTLKQQDDDKEDKKEYQWSFMMASNKTQVYQEYVVYDAMGLVGNIGGTLGLFLGFSFRDFILLFIDCLRNRLNF